MSNFFTKEASQAYDEKNSKLAPISDGMVGTVGKFKLLSRKSGLQAAFFVGTSEG